jgi:hypothetical protein
MTVRAYYAAPGTARPTCDWNREAGGPCRPRHGTESGWHFEPIMPRRGRPAVSAVERVRPQTLPPDHSLLLDHPRD